MNYHEYKDLVKFLQAITRTDRMTEQKYNDMIDEYRTYWRGYCMVKQLPLTIENDGFEIIVKYISSHFSHLVDYE